MNNFNQKITINLVKNTWKYYKKYFFATFLLVLIVGVFFSYKSTSYVTESDVLIATKSIPDEVDIRPTIMSTYKDLIISNDAVEAARKELEENGIDAYSNSSIRSSISLSQTEGSQLIKLQTTTKTEKPGAIISRSVTTYASQQIKQSFPNNVSDVINKPIFVSNSSILNLKLGLILLLASFFLGLVVLLVIETLSTRIIDPHFVEQSGLEIITEVKKNGK